jgi:hypothetical protein
MRICIQIQVLKWRLWYRRFNLMFAHARRRIEIVVTGYYGLLP